MKTLNDKIHLKKDNSVPAHLETFNEVWKTLQILKKENQGMLTNV